MTTPKRFLRGEGKTYQLGRLTVTFKTVAADNGAAYSLCETVEPPGWSAALHRHPTYDETHIICEGRYECQLGDQRLELGPGDMMFAPRGTPHSIKNVGTETGRELVINSPGGIFEAFIHEAAAALSGGEGRPNLGPGTDFRSIAAKYGIEFLA
ncbi:MAG: cupin domain-containing protein [Acidobacteriia bacterium]|nr:cupin domain-containing protein [Terriglobia bacterium]